MLKSLAVALLLSAAATAPALAYSASPERETVGVVRVGHTDLDLSQPRDAGIMLSRLNRAAGRACGDQDLRGVTGARGALKQCQAATLAVAVARLGSPEVTRRFEAMAPTSGMQLADAR